MTDALLRVRIAGFGSLRSATLEPGRLTVLIGTNGAGKSTVIRAIRMATLMRNGVLQRFIASNGGAAALLHYGEKRTHELSVELDFRQGDKSNRYTSRLGYAADDRLAFLDETVGFQRMRFAKMQMTSLGTGHSESLLREAGKTGNVTAKAVNYWLSRVATYHLRDTSNTSPLRADARAEDIQFLRSNGSNLASFLARIENSENEAEQKSWERIHECLRRVAPSVKKLCPTPVMKDVPSVRLDWVDDQGERFGIQQLSDGTLRALALITALAQPHDRLPKFICIDEPELGLHPVALQVLAELARSVSQYTQVLFATHSTMFLDFFEPDEIVAVKRNDGESTFERLDSADLKAFIEDFDRELDFEDEGLVS